MLDEMVRASVLGLWTPVVEEFLLVKRDMLTEKERRDAFVTAKALASVLVDKYKGDMGMAAFLAGTVAYALVLASFDVVGDGDCEGISPGGTE